MPGIIYFDLDDTLYRRSQPFGDAFRRFFSGTELASAPEALVLQAFAATQRRCEEVFLPSQRGEISREEMYIYRYQKGFGDIGVTISPEEALAFRDVYQRTQNCITLDPAAVRLLDGARRRYDRLGIISNGPGPHQRAKLKTLGLSRWIDEDLIVISGEIGADKPDPRVFSHAQALCGAAPGEITYVGDSVEADLLPARAAGWRAFLWSWADAEAITRSILAE